MIIEYGTKSWVKLVNVPVCSRTFVNEFTDPERRHQHQRQRRQVDNQEPRQRWGQRERGPQTTHDAESRRGECGPRLSSVRSSNVGRHAISWTSLFTTRSSASRRSPSSGKGTVVLAHCHLITSVLFGSPTSRRPHASARWRDSQRTGPFCEACRWSRRPVCSPASRRGDTASCRHRIFAVELLLRHPLAGCVGVRHPSRTSIHVSPAAAFPALLGDRRGRSRPSPPSSGSHW